MHVRHIFEKKKKVDGQKMLCFDFFYKFVRNISNSKKNWEIYDQKFILIFMFRTRYSYTILMKL